MQVYVKPCNSPTYSLRRRRHKKMPPSLGTLSTSVYIYISISVSVSISISISVYLYLGLGLMADLKQLPDQLGNFRVQDASTQGLPRLRAMTAVKSHSVSLWRSLMGPAFMEPSVSGQRGGRACWWGRLSGFLMMACTCCLW